MGYRAELKAVFYLKPIVNPEPMKWGGKAAVRHVHYVVIRPDQCTQVEREANLQDAIDFPLQFALYRRRLKGPMGGRRRA